MDLNLFKIRLIMMCQQSTQLDLTSKSDQRKCRNSTDKIYSINITKGYNSYKIRLFKMCNHYAHLEVVLIVVSHQNLTKNKLINSEDKNIQ